MFFISYLKNCVLRLLTVISLWLRPLIKWVLRRTTRLCELQRICYATVPGAERTSQIEYSLRNSRVHEIKNVCGYLDGKAEERELYPEIKYYAVYAIIRVKNINTKCNPRFMNQLYTSVGSIWSVKQLFYQVEALRNIKCTQEEESCGDIENVSGKLQQLWNYLMPEVKLERKITKQWQDVGFQGDNPTTDFRGTGLLGLECLLYFASEHNSACRHVLCRSNHPRFGYSFAIVAINLCFMTYSFLKDGTLRFHYYNDCIKDSKMKPVIVLEDSARVMLFSYDVLDFFVVGFIYYHHFIFLFDQLVLSPVLVPLFVTFLDDPPSVTSLELHHFYQVFCYFFFEFDVVWRNEQPNNIMEFSRIQKKFEEKMRRRLKNFSVILKTDFVLENV